jgi:hypothetical protein
MTTGFGSLVSTGSATNTYIANNDVPSGGSGGCTTDCAISGVFSTTSSTTPQYSFGSSTGLYGTAGSTVGMEISGTPILSVNSGAVNFGSGVSLNSNATLNADNVNINGQFTSTGSTSPEFNVGSSTGIYGTAGSTVGAMLSNSVMWAVYGSTFQLGTGVRGQQDTYSTWAVTSDARTKRNIEPYRLGLAELKMLRPILFEYNGKFGTPDTGEKAVSLIAQEVLKTPFARIVGTHKDVKTGEDILDLNNSELTYALINAVVTLSKEVDTLKRQRHVVR